MQIRRGIKSSHIAEYIMWLWLYMFGLNGNQKPGLPALNIQKHSCLMRRQPSSSLTCPLPVFSCGTQDAAPSCFSVLLSSNGVLCDFFFFFIWSIRFVVAFLNVWQIRKRGNVTHWAKYRVPFHDCTLSWRALKIETVVEVPIVC